LVGPVHFMANFSPAPTSAGLSSVASPVPPVVVVVATSVEVVTIVVAAGAVEPTVVAAAELVELAATDVEVDTGDDTVTVASDELQAETNSALARVPRTPSRLQPFTVALLPRKDSDLMTINAARSAS
jgi:hypothetical protein